MQVGKPVIATMTGGLTRQVVNHKTGEHNGVGITPAAKVLVGSQRVPYIYEDHSCLSDVRDAIVKMYNMPKDERQELGKRARQYVLEEFSLEKTVELWDTTMTQTIDNFNPKHWTCEVL